MRVSALHGLWLVCAGVVLAITIGASTVTFVLYERAVAAYHRQIGALDVALSEQTLRYFQVMDMLLQKVVARGVELQDDPQDEFRRQFGSRQTHDWLRELLKDSPDANALTVSDATGRMVALSRWYPTPDVDSSQRDYIRHFLERKDNQLFISAPFIAKAAGLPVVVMARQMNAANGGFLGVVAISLSVDYLKGLYQSANAQPGQSVTLLRQDGMVLVRSPDPTHQAGTLVPQASPWYELVRAGGGSFRSVGFLGGMPALVSVHQIQAFPLVIDVSVKEAEALAAWWNDAKWIGTTALATAAAFIFLFQVMARQIRRGEEQLSTLRSTMVELKQTAARLDDFAHTGSDWFWEQDADLRFVLIGLETPLLSPNDRSHLGKRRWEVNDTSQMPELWEKHKDDLANHRPFRDFRYDRKGSDGVRRYISISGVPVHDDAGAFVGYRGTGHDITAQVIADAELVLAKERAERAEAMMQDALDSMSEGIVIYDASDRLVLCNEAYHRMFADSSVLMVPGTPFSEILRGRIATGQFREAFGREDAWFDERVAQHRQANATFERHLPDGGWMLVTERRMRNGGVAGLRVDITTLKQAERALLDSEARLDRAQEIAGIGGWDLDLASGLYSWSKQMYRMRGLSPESFEPTRANVAASIRTDDFPKASAWIAKLQAGDHCDPIELHVMRAGSEARLLRVEGRAVVDADGVIRRLSGTMQDVTERRLIEQQLSQAQKMEAIGNLTGGMAHDFNNGLGVIIGNLDLLGRMVEGNGTATEVCDEAREAALRCADLIRGLLAFARRQPLKPRQTDVNALIRATASLLSRTLGDTITLKLHLNAALCPALADAAQLEAAVVNLAMNARDAMPAGGELDICTRNAELDAMYAAHHPGVVAGDYVLIEISDAGTGIPPEIIGRIFEPFFTTKESGCGTGLGLAMVFGFVKQSCGHLEVSSELGQGTTFRIYLPRADASDPPAAIVANQRPVAGGNESILVVEDNAKLRQVAAKQLTGLGYRILEAENADVASRILASGDQIDLLFTDIVMAGEMDGISLARHAIGLRPKLRILLASGFSSVRSPGQQPPSEFVLLDKPYRTEGLARAVREVLDLRDPVARAAARRNNLLLVTEEI